MRHLWLCGLVFLAAFANPAAAAQAGKTKRPNIIWIMSDDHANAAIGCYGSWLSKVAPTPHIDKLAKRGMRFTNYVVTNSICTPSRAAILTGQYSHKNGVYTLADPLDPQKDHYVKHLHAAGYQTAIIGKWHLHNDPEGFDYWNILPGQGRYIEPQLRSKGEKLKTYQGYSEDVITDQSLAWLDKRDKDRPFCLLVHYKAPHRPWDPAPRHANLFKDTTIPEPPTLLDDYKNRSKAAANAALKIGANNNERDLGEKPPADLKGDELRRWAYQRYMKRYLACVAAVDDNVGRIMDYLEKNGLTENTIVVYTSDQGFFLGEHGFYDKRFIYEPSILTPLIICWPGHIQPGTVNNDLVLNIDHAPTLLECAGLKATKDMQGHSYKSLLEGKTPKDWQTTMYYRYWMHGADHNVPAHYGVRTPRYTLIYFYGDPLNMKGATKFKATPPEWELFDRQKDPGQMNNVYNDPAYQMIVQDLTKELTRLRKELGDER